MNILKKIYCLGAVWLGAFSIGAQTDAPHGIPLSFAPAPEVSIGTNDIRRDATVVAVERAMPSVVSIATETLVKVSDPFEEFYREFYGQTRNRTMHNLGSGVIIDENGYLLTNDHVVRRADKIQIQLVSTRTVYEAKLVASDPKNDIALLKIIAPPGTKFSAIKFAGESELLLGETVLALGNPFGLGGSVSRGILSAKSRVMPTEGQELNMQNWLQTDAAINPGNSGGPLVNLRGELIGVNVGVLDQSGGRIARGIGFAIPVQQVTEALGTAFTPESARQLWFGAHVKPGSEPLSVMSVQPGSPAALAGLRVGDAILKVNGNAPHGFVAFNEMIAAAPDTNVSLAISRDGGTQNLKVRLVPEKSFFNAELIQSKLGISVQEITPELVSAMDLPVRRGFIVGGVDAKSPAAAQLQRGAVIVGLDDQSPADLTAFAKILFGKGKGDIARLAVVVQQRVQNGTFVQTSIRSATLEIPVR